MVNGWRVTVFDGILWVRDGKYMWTCTDGKYTPVRSTVLRWPHTKAGEFEKTRGVLFLPEEYLL